MGAGLPRLSGAGPGFRTSTDDIQSWRALRQGVWARSEVNWWPESKVMSKRVEPPFPIVMFP